MAPERRLVVVTNERSTNSKKVDALLGTLHDHYPAVDHVPIQPERSTTSNLIKASLAERAFALVVMGGDGTIKSTCDTLMELPEEERPPVAAIGLGNQNDGPHALHYNSRDPIKLLEESYVTTVHPQVAAIERPDEAVQTDLIWSYFSLGMSGAVAQRVDTAEHRTARGKLPRALWRPYDIRAAAKTSLAARPFDLDLNGKQMTVHEFMAIYSGRMSGIDHGAVSMADEFVKIAAIKKGHILSKLFHAACFRLGALGSIQTNDQRIDLEVLRTDGPLYGQIDGEPQLFPEGTKASILRSEESLRFFVTHKKLARAAIRLTS